MSRSHVTVDRRHHAVIGRLLLGAIVALVVALLAASHPSISRGGSAENGTAWAAGGSDVGAPSTGDAGAPALGTRHADHVEQARTYLPPRWVRATLSHYGEGDGYMWQRTSCGKIVRPSSTFVAALHRDLAHCGMRITILYRWRKYHTRVEDRGAWRSDDRALDAAPGLRRAMGFRGVARIQYVRGWR